MRQITLAPAKSNRAANAQPVTCLPTIELQTYLFPGQVNKYMGQCPYLTSPTIDGPIDG